MRLIDAEYLLYGMGMFSERENGAEFMKGAEAVAKMIEEAETVHEPDDWTPCAEGLPTVKETVLATIADGFGNDIMFAWYDGENWKDGYKNKIPVIAWQHLPTPYRADDTTGKVKEDA